MLKHILTVFYERGCRFIWTLFSSRSRCSAPQTGSAVPHMVLWCDVVSPPPVEDACWWRDSWSGVYIYKHTYINIRTFKFNVFLWNFIVLVVLPCVICSKPVLLITFRLLFWSPGTTVPRMFSSLLPRTSHFRPRWRPVTQQQSPCESTEQRCSTRTSVFRSPCVTGLCAVHVCSGWFSSDESTRLHTLA